MSPILSFVDEQLVPLPEINQGWTWLIVKTYAIDKAASAEDLLDALIADKSFSTHEDMSPESVGHVVDDEAFEVSGPGRSHGPYWISALSPSSFERIDADSAERRFGDWIANEGPTVPLDPEPTLAREIRPRLAGDLYVLQDLAGPGPWSDYANLETLLLDQHPILSGTAQILGGWVEVVSIEREHGRLSTVAAGSD